jgi:enoyl-CoA hydratase/carnithine racemase
VQLQERGGLTYSEIETCRHDSVLQVTLNRPHRLNAWTDTMEHEVRHATATANDDDSIRAVVITGAGRGFCAGADMDQLTAISADSSVGDDAVTMEGAQGALAGRYTWLASLDVPVIAAINGPCVGLGLVIACFADVRFAARSATFSTTFARRGLVAEHGIAWILPRLVGHGRASDLLLSARRIAAQEACEIGLVSAVLDDEALVAHSLDYARDLAANVSPRSMRIIKRQIYHGWLEDLGSNVRIADAEVLASFQSEDFREGIAHFVERRAARFTGR